MEQQLQNIGLTKTEAKVYLALLELGSSTTGPVIEKSGVASSKIYEILERLIQKGLVSFIIKGKIKYFEAASPERIMNYLEKKELAIKNQKQEVEKIMPRLLLKKQLAGHESEAKIYKGFKGMETAFMQGLKLMNKGETYYVYGVPSRSKRENSFFVKFDKERQHLGIRMQIIFNESARGEAQTISTRMLGEIKYMSENIITPASINIFKDRTLIFPACTEKEPIVIEINNHEVAESFKAQFDIFWNQKTRVYIGLDGPKTVLRELSRATKEIVAMGIDSRNFINQAPEETRHFIEEIEKNRTPQRLLFKEKTGFVPPNTSKVRHLPIQYFSPLHIEIYENSVALIDWTKPITTIIIDKKEIAEGYRKYFELLWKIAKKG